MKQKLLILAGHFSLSLGIVGIFLPVLPTTPFLLISAACYFNNSKRFYNWLIGHRIFGRYIRSYMRYGAVSQKARIFSLASLWIVMTLTIVFFVNAGWLRILLFIIALAVTVHLMLLKPLTEEMGNELDKEEISARENASIPGSGD